MVLYGARGMAVSGRENVPRRGSLIVAANHLSYWDPVIVGCVMDRQVHFMAKKPLFEIPVLGPFITAVGGFPVDRGRAGAGTIKLAAALLREGKVLGIFPEGTRSRSGLILPPELGTFLLAAKTDTPVLPVAIAGSRGMAGRVRVYIGEMMAPPERDGGRTGLTAYGRRWAEEINRLLGLV